jgi:hypothetical protein
LADFASAVEKGVVGVVVEVDEWSVSHRMGAGYGRGASFGGDNSILAGDPMGRRGACESHSAKRTEMQI